MPVFLDGQQNLAGLSAPGVYGDIILPTPFLAGVPTNIEGLVGVASWGPLNTLIPVSKPVDASIMIGPPVSRTYDMSSYVAAASQVGGAIGFYCIRVSDGTDAAASVAVQSGAAQAAGWIQINSNPTTTNINVNGTVVTFGTDVVVGPNAAATCANLLTFLQSSGNSNINKMTYAMSATVVNQIVCTSIITGTGGNAYTLTVGTSGATCSVSGANLTGGAGSATGITVTAKYSGVLGNKINFSIQNGSAANSYMGVVAFPGMVPEQFNNIAGPTPATGSLTMIANPTPSDTVGICGTTITFLASGANLTTQVNIGATVANTMVNLMTLLVASTDSNLIKATYSLNAAQNVLTVTANQTISTGTYGGSGGNSLTLAASNANSVTRSAATLSGGTGTWNTFWTNLATALNSGTAYHGPSSFVVATAGAAAVPPTLSTTSTLAGGTDGTSGVTDATLMGQDIYPRKGMYALRNSNCDAFTLCDLSAIADYAAITSFALSETMLGVQGTVSGDTISNCLATRTNSGIDSPWLWLIMGDYPSFYDNYNQTTRLINPAAFGIGILGNLSPQQSPLNKPLQGVSATQRSSVGGSYSDAELTQINNGGIDVILPPVNSPGGYYFSFASGRNASSNTGANGVEYTRMTNFLIRASQSKAAGSFVGQLQSIQPNDQTRQNAKALFDGFSAQLASSEVGLGISGQGMIDKPWQVVCDLTNNPPDLQARGYLFVYWVVRYLNVIRYFVVKFQGGGNVNVSVQNTVPSPSQFAPVANTTV